ncbi:MAG: HD domain-containing protein [Candidatus Omnitrophota bacterium]
MAKTINQSFKKLKKFRNNKLLQAIQEISELQKQQVYLVGGALRDLFFKQKKQKKTIDWDFTIKSGALDFAKKLARRLDANYVLLDEKHKTARVICYENNQEFRLDFTDFRAKTLRGDLKKRDFTINSLYADVKDLLNGKAKIIDCFNAKEDIKDKILRITNKNNFKDDPLRILRGYAFSCQLGFSFDQATSALVKNNVFRLADVSPERISEELAKIFGAKCIYKHILKMDSFGVLDLIFPEIKALRGVEQGLFHHLDVWNHSLESLAQLEKLLRVLPKKIPANCVEQVNAYLEEELWGNRSRLWILKMACLMHDIAKPQTRSVGEDKKVHFYTHEKQGAQIVRRVGKRLKLSRKEIAVLSDIVLYHLRAGQLVNRMPSKRSKFRFLRDTADNAVLILLFTISDRWAMRGSFSKSKKFIFYEQELFKMIVGFFKDQNTVNKNPRLLNGNEVMSLLGVSKGPLIGKILAQIEEAQAIKSIRNKQQAENLASRLYAKMRQ